MNTCKKCGVEIPDDSLFCPNCLEEITLKGNSYDSENSNTLRENKLTNNSAKKSNIEKIIGAIMGVLAIVVIIIIGWILGQKSQMSPKENDTPYSYTDNNNQNNNISSKTLLELSPTIDKYVKLYGLYYSIDSQDTNNSSLAYTFTIKHYKDTIVLNSPSIRSNHIKAITILSSDFATDADMDRLLNTLILYTAYLPGGIASIDSLLKKWTSQPISNSGYQIRGAKTEFTENGITYCMELIQEGEPFLMLTAEIEDNYLVSKANENSQRNISKAIEDRKVSVSKRTFDYSNDSTTNRYQNDNYEQETLPNSLDASYNDFSKRTNNDTNNYYNNNIENTTAINTPTEIIGIIQTGGTSVHMVSHIVEDVIYSSVENIKTIPENTRCDVTVNETSDGWTNVMCEGINGWVKEKYVYSEDGQDYIETNSSKIYIYNIKPVGNRFYNKLEVPDDYRVICNIPKGEKVKVLGADTQWEGYYQVDYNGQVGWVKSRFVDCQ